MKKNKTLTVILLGALTLGSQVFAGENILKENLDTSVSPKVDFYQYACGGWMNSNPLTAEYSRFGSFDLLRNNNVERLNKIILKYAEVQNEPGSIGQKIGDLYNLAMDTVKLEKEGITPLIPYLQKIESISTVDQLLSTLPELNVDGANAYFAIYLDANPMSSKENMVQTYQSGLTLGQKDYYVDEDSKTKEIMAKYRSHIINMFKLAGYSSELAVKKMNSVLEIETKLAQASKSRTQLRDNYANYNKMTVAQFQDSVKQINWPDFLNAMGLKTPEYINVSQPEFMKSVGELMYSVSLETHKDYLQWKMILLSAPYMNDVIYNEHFDFFGRILSGKESPRPRWKRAVNSVDGILGEAVGQMYVKEYFPPAAKARMLELVHNLQDALHDRINNLSWMGDSTKEKAVEKLNAFYVKIGYPDKWRSYDELQVKKDSYFENIIRSNKFDYAYMFSKQDSPVDRDEWHMTPQTVNAYYNPTTNEICFPAAILQPPFFDMHADDSFNYGAIGVVIGHEMTHGFDDQGCNFDKEGNLNNWWTESDKKNFDERATVLASYFDSIVVAPGVYANGRLTLGENIADNGGLKVSYDAFRKAIKKNPLKNIYGITPDQRFYLSYSGVWAGNIRPEEILVLTKSDPHSLAKWRVNGALPHIDNWYKVFNVKEGDPMFLAKEKRASVW